MDCGHFADVYEGCRRCGEAQISDRQAEAAAVALDHLDAQGLPGLADERTCRGLWRIGRHDLAVAVHQRTTGAA